MQYEEIEMMFYTKNKSGIAMLKIPANSKEKADLIIASGYTFEVEHHPNSTIGVTTAITDEELGDFAIVSSANITDWKGHAAKVGKMIDNFDISTADEIRASQ